ncbi:hypothetical protein [Aeoliella sp.]|uniref:hypothetical protein n=1 Tax=Aeoliella sp. TaxID=2795800 RepID=UPI003CCBD08B
MPQLQKLTLVDTSIGDEGVEELRERYPKVSICQGQNPFDSSTVSENPFAP